MTNFISHKAGMAENRRTAEALILNGPDGVARQFLLAAIERRTGIKLPSCLQNIDNSKGRDNLYPSPVRTLLRDAGE